MILILLKGAFIQDSPLSNIMETFGGLNPERIITRMAADFQLKPSAVDDGDAFDCGPPPPQHDCQHKHEERRSDRPREAEE